MLGIVSTTDCNLENTFADVTEPDMIAEPLPVLLAGNTPVDAAIDADNAFWNPPNCPLVALAPCQIDSSVASATFPPT